MPSKYVPIFPEEIAEGLINFWFETFPDGRRFSWVRGVYLKLDYFVGQLE